MKSPPSVYDSRFDDITGAFVISLDFELHWGVRDRHSINSEYANVLRATRQVIPRILAIFREYEVAATWATVGFLFARSDAELSSYSPVARPTYIDARLNPYGEPIGADEVADPLHFAPSLIELIRSTPRQEIATHTFSHYYCGEPGQTAEQFAADLEAAVTIAKDSEIRIESIVYPRNQHNQHYVDILVRSGIRSYRGNPPAWMWRFDNTEGSGGAIVRLGRLVDSYLNVGGQPLQKWETVVEESGLANVRATAFLRPYTRRLSKLEPLRYRRIERGIRRAARDRSIYHIWWHPHNMGANQIENLDFLRRVLDGFAKCRDSYGMQAMTMRDVAKKAQSHENWSTSAGPSGSTAAS